MIKRGSSRTAVYILGEKSNIYDDEIHEIVHHKDSVNLKRDSLVKHVCGMLNSGKFFSR